MTRLLIPCKMFYIETKKSFSKRFSKCFKKPLDKH
ncbi:hypothetical protein [Shigella phage ESh22]|nr:hypothetical protein [Shigella phage ESh21]URY12727.1 hypothetical protein [Shigella phage ESh22]